MSSRALHWSRKCDIFSAPEWQSGQSGLTANWLKVARFACSRYVYLIKSSTQCRRLVPLGHQDRPHAFAQANEIGS